MEDVALLTEIISGYEARDSTSLDQPKPDLVNVLQSSDLRGIKIGILKDALDREGIDTSIQDAVNDAAKVFQNAGAELVEIQLPPQ